MASRDDQNTYTVQREITIDAPPERVYASLVDFHRWIDWSPWEGLDPSMRRTYGGAESGVGAVYEWAGKRKVGQGRMEIVDVEPPSRLDIELDFVKPFKAHNTTRFVLRPDGAGTHVTWTMTGAKTLMTKVMGIFTSMDKLVGRDFEKGLSQLKASVEA